MGEMSKLGWLITWSDRDIGQILSISCMWCLIQSARPSLLTNIFCCLVFNTCWANFDISSRFCVRLHLCFVLHTSTSTYFADVSAIKHEILYTHCFVYRASVIVPVFISVLWSVCLALKMVLTRKQFAICLSFLEISSIYGIMTVL